MKWTRLIIIFVHLITMITFSKYHLEVIDKLNKKTKKKITFNILLFFSRIFPEELWSSAGVLLVFFLLLFIFIYVTLKIILPENNKVSEFILELSFSLIICAFVNLIEYYIFIKIFF